MASEHISVSSGSASGGAGAAVGEAGAMSGVSGAAVGEAGAAVEAPGAASDVLGDVSDVLLEGVQAAALDALLAHASTPPPPVGLEERVLEAIRREESSLPASIRGSLATPPLRPTPWYARRRVWFSSAAAACLFAALLPFLPLGEENRTGESLAIDDAILVDDALDLIADEELITAICSVSTGKDSFMSNQ